MTEEVTTTEEITQDPPSDNGLLSVDEFAEKIKAKYPQYKDMDNLELTNKIIAKYPSYKDQVNISGQVEKKNPIDTSSNGEEVLTESITETETSPGSLASLQGSDEQPVVTDDYDYLEDEFNILNNPPKEEVFYSKGFDGPQFVPVKEKEIDPVLKQKLLSDFNISKALENGVIDEKLIESALKGNQNAIQKLQQLSVKRSETYTQELNSKKLNVPYAYESSSELSEFVSPEGEAEAKKSIRDKIKAYDAESARLQAKNPNATGDELNALINRPDDPNFVTEKEYELVEDDYTPTGFEDSDIHMMYDSQGLKNVKGFNIKDFDGYLKEQGYMDKYMQLLEDETISEDGRSYDMSGNYNPTLASERLKAQYLTNYINNQVERNVESQVLQYQADNSGKHPSFDGVQLNFSTGVDDIALATYIEEQFPSLTARLKNQDVENQENYQKYLDGENPWFTQSVKQGWRSVEDRIHSFSKGVYGFIGMNSVADEIRMRDAQDDLERDDFMRYAYASGKKALVNGREYGIDERGQIYDLKIKKNVTNVLSGPMADSIKNSVSQSNDTFKSISGSGTVIATTGIATDMLLQIALTRGVGNVGRGGSALLGSFDKGTKAVNILKSIPMKATTASAMIAQGTLFSTNLASSTYDQAISNGLDEATAVELRQKAGMQGFALGTMTAPISTQAVAMNKIFGSKATEKVTKGLVDAYQKGGDKGLNAYFQKIQQKIIQNYPVYIQESGKEVFQENVQQAGQAFVIADNVNEVAGREIMNNTITGAEYTNTTILAGAAGLLMPFGGDMVSATSTSIKANFNPGAAAIDRMEALHGLSKDVDKTTKFLNSMVQQNVYTEEQVSNLLGDIDLYVNTINSIPTNLSPETSLVVMNSINEIQKQEQLKKERDKSFHPEIDQKIQNLRNEIRSRTQFDYVNSKGKLKLKDEAGKELVQEAEERGETNYTISDGAITQRAIDNFNVMDVDTKLEYTDLNKSDLKTDKTKEDAVQKQETGNISSDQSSEDSQEVETEVRESSEETQEEVEVTKDLLTPNSQQSSGLYESYVSDTAEVYLNAETNKKNAPTGGFDVEVTKDGVTVSKKFSNFKEAKAYAEKIAANDAAKSTPSPTVDTSTDEEVEETKDFLTPNSPGSEGRFENYSSDKVEVTISAQNDKGEGSTSKDTDYRFQVRVNTNQGGQMTRSKALTKNFKTSAEAKAYAEKIAANDAAKSTPSPTVDTSTNEEVMSVNNENSVESFANRIVEQDGTQDFSEDALQFYAENKEAIDNAVSQKKKNVPKDKSRERSLAIKIARGDTEFSNADIDLYAGSEAEVQAEVEAIGQTSNTTITPETYKAILASTKSTTRQDMAKPESENAQRKRFWKSWNKSAKEKKMDLKQKRKSLNDGIKAYAKKRKGTITPAQTRAIINKINEVNLDNPIQVKRVQEYAEKIFGNADYANDLDIANNLAARTTKRLNSGKLSDNSNLEAAVSQLVTTPLTDLDPATLKSYNEFLAKIAKQNKTTKLNNELVQEANDLLKSTKPQEINTESEIEFDETKGQFVYKEGTQKIINKILNPDISGETLIEENSEFIEKKLDALDSGTLEILVDKVNSSENESNSGVVEAVNDYAKNRASLINTTAKKSKKLNLNNGLSKISLEQSIGPKTLKNLNKGQLAMLTGSELAELDVHLENISEGFYTYYANKIAQKVEGNQRAVNIAPVLNKMFTAKGKFSTMRQYAVTSMKNSLGKAGVGGKSSKSIGVVGQMIRSNPLNVIDNMFGNYKNNAINENLIRPTAEAHARFKNFMNEQTDIIDAVESLIAPSRTESINNAVQRRFELTTYLLQKEFESNSNKKGTNPAIKFIEGTIDKYNSDKKSSKYNQASIDILSKIAKKYSDNGQISLKKMDESMSTKTKRALQLLEKVYAGLGSKQAYATRIVRGNEIDLINNYVHHKAVFQGQERNDASYQDAVSYINNPGTKSKTSFERTNNTAIDFDPINTALRATKSTGMDFYLSNEIASTRQSMNSLKGITQNNKLSSKKQDQLNEAVLDLNKIYSESLNNVVSNNMSSQVIGGEFMNSLKTLGYYGTLASIPRAGAELASNLAFAALSAPGEITLGMTKYLPYSMDTNNNNRGRLVVENVDSTSQTKLYADEQLGGSKAETQGVQSKKSSPKAKGKLGSAAEILARNTGVKYIPKVVNKIGEVLITKPDQMISRPLWFGTFATSFKAETGTEVNFDKIADKDSDYMNKYSDAIKKATRKADGFVTMAATSNDPFSAVLKNQAQDGEGALNFYRMINSYMSKFSLNEYATARQAVASMMGQGQLGVVRGAGTLAGVGLRMTMYVMLLRYFGQGMFGMLGIGDDEDDTDYEELGFRQSVGAATSLLSRGVAGNIPMMPLNFTIEQLNKDFGYELGLRSNEEYNGFEDALLYATINPDNAKRNLSKALLIQASGPFNPYMKSAIRGGELLARGLSNSTEESKQENLDKLFSSRTAIEIANMFGGVPFYRDIRRGFLEEEYKEEPGKLEPFSLKEMKEFDPKGYEKLIKNKQRRESNPKYKKQMEKLKEQEERLKKMMNK